MRDAEKGRAQRFAWAVLGSAWVHILIASVVLFGMRCLPQEPASAREDRVAAVLLVAPEEAGTSSADEAPPPQDEAGSDGSSELDDHALSPALEEGRTLALDAEALESLAALSAGDLEQLELADLEKLAALDLEALDPETLASIQQQLDPALLARLAAALPPDDPRVAMLQSVKQRLPAGAASAPKRATPSTAPAPGAAPAPQQDEEAPGSDPDDAVADASLREVPKTEKSLKDAPEDEEREEEEDEEEEAEEEEPTKDPRWKRYLRADEAQRRQESLTSDYISSRDSRAEELRRVEVTSDVDGANTPPLDGLPIEAGTPSLDLADGEPDEDGGDAPAEGEPVEKRVPVEIGGGSDGDEPGLGSPLEGEGKRGGAPARSGRRAAASASAVVLTGGDAPKAGFKDAPRPDDRPSRRTGWWAPKVARIVVQAPDITPAEAPITAALDLEQVAEAPEPRPDEEDDRGGTEQPVEVDEELPESTEDEPAPESGEPDPEELVEEEPEEPVETIADLRAAMGWGGMKQARTKPRRSMPGIATTDGNLRSSKQTASKDLMLERFAVVDAVDSPLGRYRAQLDEEVKLQWHTMDLSLHERALGIQGDVSVVFQIQRNGKVTEKSVTRSSGHTSLDGMALDAVPEKLPRFPKELEQDSLFHEYTFIYRNPIIVSGDTR